MDEPFISKIIASYRITIPKKVRERLQLQEGDLIEAVVIRKIERSPTISITTADEAERTVEASE